MVRHLNVDDGHFSSFVQKIGLRNMKPEQVAKAKERLMNDLIKIQDEDKLYYECLRSCHQVGGSIISESREALCEEKYCSTYFDSYHQT